MRRYRIFKFHIDSTRNIVGSDNPADNLRIEEIKKEMKNSLVLNYGQHNFDIKFKRYMELEAPSLSVVEEHTFLLEDICDAYVQGSFYSALTGACCLGERIFNNVIFKVFNDFKSSEQYKEVFNKNRRGGSIIDWDKGISILKNWNIINDEVELKFKRLSQLRTGSVHYQNREQDLEQMSLEAINVINFIVNKLFGLNQTRRDILLWFDVPGELYIRNDAEKNPLIKAFYLPCSFYVGPRHDIKNDLSLSKLTISDNHSYGNTIITDDEFVRLRKEYTNKRR